MLAEQILWQLPMLRPRSRERIRAALLGLVDAETLRLAEQRLGIPEADRPGAEVQAGQHEVVDRHTRLDYHDRTGCKQDVWRLCDQEHYPQVEHEYGTLGLLRLTTSGRMEMSISHSSFPWTSRLLPGRVREARAVASHSH